MTARSVFLSIGAACLLVVGTSSHAAAQTPDGLSPAEEPVCDEFHGRAFGLCNAYCEATDCHLKDEPGHACESVRSNFFKLTGLSALPCDEFCPFVPDPFCSANGRLGMDAEGCEVCMCDSGWTGSDCTTCEAGFDEFGRCGFADRR